MPTLLVMRHAKSDWSGSTEDDHRRGLAPRGRRAAATMGRFLTAGGLAPDAVLSSTAVRAMSTLELAAEAGDWRCPVQASDGLYDAEADAVVREIRATAGGVGRLLVVGHEPTSSELVALLVGGGRFRFPTAAVACVELGCDRWSEVGAGSGQLLWLLPPKLLKGAP